LPFDYHITIFAVDLIKHYVNTHSNLASAQKVFVLLKP